MARPALPWRGGAGEGGPSARPRAVKPVVHPTREGGGRRRPGSGPVTAASRTRWEDATNSYGTVTTARHRSTRLAGLALALGLLAGPRAALAAAPEPLLEPTWLPAPRSRTAARDTSEDGGFVLGPDHAGIGIGDVPVLHGLRLNFRDRDLRRADGIAFTVWTPIHDRVGGTVNGVALGLAGPAADRLHGLGFGLGGVYARRSLDGAFVGGLGVVGDGDLAGLALAGLGAVVDGHASGILLGGLGAVVQGDATGILAGGLGVVVDGDASGVLLGGLGTVVQGRATGLAVGGLGTVVDGVWKGIAIGGVATVTQGGSAGVALGGLATVSQGPSVGLTAAGLATLAGGGV